MNPIVVWAGVVIVLLASHPGYVGAQSESDSSLPLEDLQVFAEIFGKIKEDYVDPSDDSTLLNDAIRGMLQGLDPHSAYLRPDAYSDIRESTEGKFGGLGIEVTTEDGFIKVVAPIDDTPAYDAGLKPNDIIVMLDDKPVRGIGLRAAVESMRGPPGTPIKLTIAREGIAEPFEVTLVRAVIRVTSVRSEEFPDGFAYIRISSFQSRTAANLENRLEEMQENMPDGIHGLVLDLRNNPGGVLRGAVEVSDLFLASGPIVSTRGRNEDNQSSYLAKSGDVLDDAPIVVLVNGGSASASEIVAGALQDHKRAIILGTKTFGKGSVQTVIPMNNGAALKMTTARYYTPSNRSIQATGIIPDIEVEQLELRTDDGSSRQVRESDLAGHLENDAGDDDDSATDVSSESNLEKRLQSDFQLREAVNLLKGMSLVKRRSEFEPDEG
ncbi:MAG: S41 family peptidase [Pseudomonadota bacterium]